MSEKKSAQARYTADVLRFLGPWPKLRAAARRSVCDGAAEYLDENPSAGYDDLCEKLGTPKSFADNLLETSTDRSQLYDAVRRASPRRLIVALVIALALIVGCSVFVPWAIDRATTERVIVITGPYEDDGPLPENSGRYADPDEPVPTYTSEQLESAE